MKRRQFIQNLGKGAFVASFGSLPLDVFSQNNADDVIKLTILHTNDVHSRIEPFPLDGSKFQGRGGASRRATLIQDIRKAEKNVLLFDAGDMFQGTPYFNFYGGELELKLMSKMGYDAATIGNHDFDGGVDGLKKQLIHASFPLINANYNFSDTVMKGGTLPNKIFEKDGLKIGVFGVGIELNGLVPKAMYLDTLYADPLTVAQAQATYLKQDMKCDYVVCLSHLGYKYDNDKISDLKLAAATSDIDLIIGGHTHTFLEKAEITKNKNGNPVTINQVGWAGLMLGRIDIQFERNRKGHCVSCSNSMI
jgi:5'-nucleotidase